MKKNLINIIGPILWWTEGTKSRRDLRWKSAWTYPVEITNTNPQIIEIFLNFLRNEIGINEKRLKVQLQIHKGDDQDKIEKYWSKITQIPLSRFTKTIIRPQGKKIGKTMGTCKVRFIDKHTHQLLDKLVKDIVKKVNGV
jgi:hypothetical protein